MKFWVKHILFFSTIILVTCITAHASGKPEYYASDLQEFSAPAEDLQRKMEGIAETFQKPAKDKDAFKQFQKKEKEILDIYEQYYGNLEKPTQQIKKEEIVCDNPVEVDYYFSFSMPGSSIKTAIADALALRKDCVKVKMYLRGLIDNNLKKTIVTFYSISKANPEDLPIEIDPKKFKKENIIVVPTVIVKGKRFTGDMRLSGMIYNLDALQAGKVAVTYPVREEDLAELFKKRAPMAEQKMREYIASDKARDKFKLTRYDGQFTHAKKKKTYYIDPTQTLMEDIRDHKGIILFPKGTTVNPLDQVNMSRYIFIDGNIKEQVALALKGKYRKIILVSGDVYDLGKKFKKTFYHTTDELISLFQVKRVPLIVEPEGRLIRATEQPI